MGEMHGYPASGESNQYSASGQLAKVVPGTVGNHIIHYWIDCAPGCSGSSVKVTDQNWQAARLQQEKREQLYDYDEDELADSFKRTIAVHTGNKADEGTNFGTLITPEIKSW